MGTVHPVAATAEAMSFMRAASQRSVAVAFGVLWK